MTSQAIHKREKEQFIKLFKEDRISHFEDRLAILEVFLHTEHHVTAQELADAVRENGYRLDDDFIRETIELMCHYGFAQANRFDNGQIRYEHRHLGQHHDHLICTKCKRIVEFENREIEQLQAQIVSNYGFHLLQHKMELYGICRDCLAHRDVVLALDTARPGERLRVVAFRGGARLKMRLVTMGLRMADIQFVGLDPAQNDTRHVPGQTQSCHPGGRAADGGFLEDPRKQVKKSGQAVDKRCDGQQT